MGDGKKYTVAMFAMHNQVLAGVLGLPEGAVIRFVNVERQQSRILIYVEHPDLPEIPEGAPIPEVTPVFTNDTTPEGIRLPTRMVAWGLPQIKLAGPTAEG
jgi:hypothetical protein